MNDPVDPVFSRRLLEDDYFQHLLKKQLDLQFKEALQPAVEKATSNYWGTRWKLAVTALGTVLGISSLFGYSSWNQIRTEARGKLEEVHKGLADIDAKRKSIDELAARISDVATTAEKNGKTFQESVKTSLVDARGVVKEYLDSTHKLSTETFGVLQSSLTQASNDTNRLQTVAGKMDDTAKLAEDQLKRLRAQAEEHANKLQTQTILLSAKLQEIENRRAMLDKDMQQVEALRQFAATSASEVFALRPHPPYNSVTLLIPDLDNPAQKYEINFNSAGLAPPISLAVNVNHPDSRKRWAGPLPIRTTKEPVRIGTLPILVEMDFLYHTKVAPDFAIMRVRYDPVAIRQDKAAAQLAAGRP